MQTYTHRDGLQYTFPEAPRVRPYRLLISGWIYRPVRRAVGRNCGLGMFRRGEHTVIERVTAGWHGWTADQTAEPHRLQGSGTFLFAGGLRAVAAVRATFRDPRVCQVSLRTNQDRAILVYNRQADGRITHYRSDGDGR